MRRRLQGSCIRRDRAETDGMKKKKKKKKRDHSLIAQEKPLLSMGLNIFGRHIESSSKCMFRFSNIIRYKGNIAN